MAVGRAARVYTNMRNDNTASHQGGGGSYLGGSKMTRFEILVLKALIVILRSVVWPRRQAQESEQLISEIEQELAK
jgi:hypothetical protein